MPQEIKKDRVKIDAPLDNIIDLVKGAFEGPGTNQPVETPAPKSLPSGIPAPSPIETAQTLQANAAPEQDTMGRLKDLLEKPPLLSENKPSGLRRFGAAVAGGLAGAAGGPEVGVKTAKGILEQPYAEQYQDWLTRSGALEKQAGLEIEGQKADASSLNATAAIRRASGANDPTLQGNIEESKYRGREKALEPGRVAASDREQEKIELTQRLQAIREGNLEEQRQGGRETLEDIRQTGREKISQDQIDSLERRAKNAITSRENVAELGRKLRKELASSATKNQRVPPTQQAVGRMLAEDEISKLITNQDEFDALFDKSTDSQGRPIIRLKPDRDVKAEWVTKYKTRKREIDDLLKQILKASFSPAPDTGDEEEENDEDRYDSEELEE